MSLSRLKLGFDQAVSALIVNGIKVRHHMLAVVRTVRLSYLRYKPVSFDICINRYLLAYLSVTYGKVILLQGMLL